MKDEIYIIGSGFAPEWCRRFIQPYRKMDGSTGYEYHGKSKDIHLNKGDVMIRGNDGKISFRREGEH